MRGSTVTVNVDAGLDVTSLVSATTIGGLAGRGAINLGTRTLELNGGLLVNNGTVPTGPPTSGVLGGTVNINYGGLPKGAGYYESVGQNFGGTFGFDQTLIASHTERFGSNGQAPNRAHLVAHEQSGDTEQQ